VTIERDQAAYGEEPSVRLPFEAIAEARLVLTDELIREALKKDKEARRELKKRRRAKPGEEETGTGEELGTEEEN
jgi:ribosome maturation factor RimP